MEKFSSKFVEFFVSNNLIKNEDKEIYEYAFNIILSSLIHIATVMIIGLCFNLFIESLAFYFSFIAIRKFAGGYHAKTATRCYLFSSLINIIVLFLIKLFCYVSIYFLMILIVIEILCVILISHIAPLDSDNNLLNGKEKKFYGKISCSISTALLCISIVTINLNYIKIGISIMFGVFMSAAVLLAKYVQNVFIDNKDDEHVFQYQKVNLSLQKRVESNGINLFKKSKL